LFGGGAAGGGRRLTSLAAEETVETGGVVEEGAKSSAVGLYFGFPFNFVPCHLDRLKAVEVGRGMVAVVSAPGSAELVKEKLYRRRVKKRFRLRA
jgi:hypothetical protein